MTTAGKRECTMRLKLDKESDVLYFRLSERAIVDSEEVRPGVILDCDKDGHVIGVEFLGIRVRMSAQELALLNFEIIEGLATSP